MNLDGKYFTIADKATGEYKDRGSKFISYAFPIQSIDSIPALITAVKKAHPKARHYCYAYRFGMDGNIFRAHDDGEPGNTAGRPILGQIDSLQLTNVVVIVVRYFGGTLLGKPGLTKAYKESAHDALIRAAIIEKWVEDVVRIKFEYALLGDLMEGLKKTNAAIIHQRFNENPEITIAVRQMERQNIITSLKAQIGKISLEEAGSLESLPGLTIEFMFTR